LQTCVSDQRAASVKAWLVAKEAFNAATFRTQGFGAAHPATLNTKADGARIQREGELIIEVKASTSPTRQ
jgi:outer membrane protein OmpA-like peptidoglycan-associated protein